MQLGNRFSDGVLKSRKKIHKYYGEKTTRYEYAEMNEQRMWNKI